MNEIITIARKEFMDNWRNKWILGISTIFLILTLVISYFGSRGGVGWKDLDVTITGMINLVTFLIPIIGLMLGYASIVGEEEKGSLELLLCYPVRRVEVLFGKFLGLSAVMAVANFIGFGVAGIVIGINVKGVQWSSYGIFIISSILLGIVFIAIAMLFSCLFKKRSTAMAGTIFLWFLFEMIWGVIVAGILIAQYGIEKMTDQNFVAPNWYYLLSLINPIKAYSTLVSLNTPINNMIGKTPSFVNTPFMLIILFSWMIASLLIAYYIFNRKNL